jgi:hypothetical protein
MIITPHKPQITQPVATYTPIVAKIISATPGRLRLRIHPATRQAENIQHIANFLAGKSHINQVRTNLHQGSILINYDANASNLAAICALLQEINIIFADINQGNTEAAIYVKNAATNLNQEFKRATDGKVDLRFLFPLGLSILAIRQLMIKGWQLEIIPWYVLAWYAFNSFLKLNNANIAQTYSPSADDRHC